MSGVHNTPHAHLPKRVWGGWSARHSLDLVTPY